MTITPETFPVPLITVDRTKSTNNYLRDYCLLRERTPFTTVIADYQTAGRGQRGNFWESERGRNLLFSTVLFPHFLKAQNQFLLSQVISLAIKEALDNYTKGISIKWPNDIYWQDRKICGILIENELTGSHFSQSIIGAGININQQNFTGNAPNPVSLWQITQKEHNCLEILALIMECLQTHYDLLQQGDSAIIAQRYRQALFRGNGMYAYSDANGSFLAEIVRVEPEGHLVLRDAWNKERKYAFKEVQYQL